MRARIARGSRTSNRNSFKENVMGKTAPKQEVNLSRREYYKLRARRIRNEKEQENEDVIRYALTNGASAVLAKEEDDDVRIQ
jgi:hypothetical protein